MTGASPIYQMKWKSELCIYYKRFCGSFIKHRPPKRKKFLSYSYVFKKIFKIFDLEEYDKYFNLPKGKHNLKEPNKIWEKVYEDMGWKFHYSM